MPIQECQINGVQGYKWGDKGKCYTGPDAKDKALKQAVAIGEFAETYNDYPQAATENAKIALRWAEENGWGSCGTPIGKARANQLAKRENISRDTIGRMAAFERHRQNSQKALGDGCGRLMWLAWGGDEGVEWAQRKLRQIDKQKLVDQTKVSLDFDDVLTTDSGKELAKQLLNDGLSVYIVTRRSELFGSPVYKLAESLNIPVNKVYFTGGYLKWDTIKRLNISKHWDSNENEIDKINELTDAEGILFNKN